MFRLVVTPEIQAEIEEIKTHDVMAAASALVLLETLRDDPSALEDLCVAGNRFNYDPAYEVKRFVAAQQAGYNIYILKYRDADDHVPPYRILIGFHAQKDTYYALAIANRSISYDVRDHAFGDLRNRYERCGIPVYR